MPLLRPQLFIVDHMHSVKTGLQSPGILGVATSLDDFVKMPHIATAALLVAKETRITRIEPLFPATDRFEGKGNAAIQNQFPCKT